MNPTLRNILAVIVGCLIGGVANMMIIKYGGGEMDIAKMQNLKETMTIGDAVIPFCAHAGGTLIGAIIAVLLGASHKMTLALIVGVFFLLGGITACFLIPAPIWFIALDLIGAYLPMGWLAAKIFSRQA